MALLRKDARVSKDFAFPLPLPEGEGPGLDIIASILDHEDRRKFNIEVCRVAGADTREHKWGNRYGSIYILDDRGREKELQHGELTLEEQRCRGGWLM